MGRKLSTRCEQPSSGSSKQVAGLHKRVDNLVQTLRELAAKHAMLEHRTDEVGEMRDQAICERVDYLEKLLDDALEKLIDEDTAGIQSQLARTYALHNEQIGVLQDRIESCEKHMVCLPDKALAEQARLNEDHETQVEQHTALQKQVDYMERVSRLDAIDKQVRWEQLTAEHAALQREHTERGS